MTYRTHFLTLLLACFCFNLFNITIINSVHAEQKATGDLSHTIANNMQGTVTEILTVTSYTYAEVDTGKEKVWAAGPTTPLKVGDKVSFATQMPMVDFHSQSLDRDFPVVYFINRFITNKEPPAVESLPGSSDKQKKPARAIKAFNKANGGNTIAEIYAQKQALNGKSLRVRGQVTRYSSNIMGKNWLHIIDNSTHDALTVTTSSVATIDDIVIVEGRLELDKDYGYGYVYPLILQNATVTTE